MNVKVISADKWWIIPQWQRQALTGLIRELGFDPGEVWRLMFVDGSVWVFAYHLDENGRKHLDETGQDVARLVECRRLAA